MLECFFIFPGLASEFGMTKVNEADPLMGIKTIHLPVFPQLRTLSNCPSNFPCSLMLSFLYTFLYDFVFEAFLFAFFFVIFVSTLIVFLSSPSPFPSLSLAPSLSPSPTHPSILTPLPGQHRMDSSSTRPKGTYR